MTGSNEEDDDFTRFESETASVTDPPPPPGEVLRPGEEPEEPFEFAADDFISEELVAAFLCLPANMMARKTGEEWWRPEQEEVELLGKASTPGIRYLVNKYLSQSAGPLAGLGAALGIVYGPRILRQVEENKIRKKDPANPNRSQRESPSSSVNADAENQQNSSDFSVPFDES